MKSISKYPLILFFALIALLNGCDLNNNNEPEPTDRYLVSFEKHKTYLPTFIKSVLNPLITLYPDLKVIADNAQFGVEVYKITYNTKFEGKDIVASGLVAVPAGSGSFPVISYQNGTNTLNSNAPSVNPDYELYR